MQSTTVISTNRPRPIAEESTARRLIRLFCQSRPATIALIVLAVLVFLAVFGHWIAPQNPYDLAQLKIMDGQLPPGSRADGFTFWLGSDDQGRDMLSAIIYGLRISIGVGLAAAGISALIGTSIGMTAAYIGGRLETLVMRLVDFQLSFPPILIALMLLAVLGRSILNVVMALVIVGWASYARTARSSALIERRKEYIEAAESLVIPKHRIIFHHLLPNCLPPQIILATVQIARAITLEATLSFLGLGVPVTQPSLGLLIANGYEYMLTGAYWISVFPGCALLVLIVAINLVADRLREVLNPTASS